MPNDAQQTTEPAQDLTGTEFFLQAIGNGHKPAVLGKYQASHPTNIRRVYEEALARHPEAADVIAALVFWRQIDRNREAFLKETSSRG